MGTRDNKQQDGGTVWSRQAGSYHSGRIRKLSAHILNYKYGALCVCVEGGELGMP